MKLWLDDLRAPPPGDDWVWAQTVRRAKEIFRSEEITELSLDYELGEDAEGRVQPNGQVLVEWMACEGRWPSGSIAIHSHSTVGVAALRDGIRRGGRFSFERATGSFKRVDGTP